MDPGFIENDTGFSNPATNANVVLLALSRMNSAGAAKLDFHATADFRLRSIDPCFRTLCGTTLNDDRQSITVAADETSSDTYWKLVFQEMELAVAHEKSRGVSTRDFQSIAVPVADQGLAHAVVGLPTTASPSKVLTEPATVAIARCSMGDAPTNDVVDPVKTTNPGSAGNFISSHAGGVYPSPLAPKSTAFHEGGV
jgi:hypothetical protein